jgi:hypothetical protein
LRFGRDVLPAWLGKKKEECCVDGSERGVKELTALGWLGV